MFQKKCSVPGKQRENSGEGVKGKLDINRENATFSWGEIHEIINTFMGQMAVVNWQRA